MDVPTLTAVNAPTPHPSRDQAVVREWYREHAGWRLGALALGFAALSALNLDGVASTLRSRLGAGTHLLLIAFTGSAVLTPLGRLLALRLGAVDWPDRRKAPARPTPRMGALAVALAIALAIGEGPDLDAPLLASFCGAASLLALGLASDLSPVARRWHAVTAVGAAIAAVGSGTRLHLALVEGWTGAAADAALTAGWLLIMTFAFERLDAASGLGAGLATVVGANLAAAGLLAGEAGLTWRAAALAGACLGFLPHALRPRRPAAVSLGRGGGPALGFLLAAFAAHGSSSLGGPARRPLVLLLLFAVPVYEVARAAAARAARRIARASPSGGDGRLPDGLESLLRSRRAATVLILLLSASAGATALALVAAPRPIADVLAVHGLVLVAVVALLDHAGRHRDRRDLD